MCEAGMVARRQVLGRGLAALAAAALLQVRSVPAQEAITPDQALARLMEGNERYVCCQTPPRTFSKDRAELALSQRPFAVILGCADSRVAPELAFDQSRGQLFVLRVAGNTLNTDMLASMEYAVAELGTPLIMVLGHSACGAVGAAIKVVEDNAQLPGHLPELVDPIKPAVEAARDRAGDLLTNAIKQNVRQTVARIESAGPIVAPAVAGGEVKVVGAVYELETGKVRLV